MSTQRHANRGFTLVELLVVIAIIGILAGFVAVAAPRAIQAAKIAALSNNANQIRTALTAYYVDYDSYPPAYGYVAREAKDFFRKELGVSEADFRSSFSNWTNVNNLQSATAAQQGSLFGGITLDSPVRLMHTTPWMHFLGYYNNRDLFDNFSVGYDTNLDQSISLLEYSPIIEPDAGTTSNFSFPSLEVYTGDNFAGQVNRQLNTDDRRPLIYCPVNQRQMRRLSDLLYGLDQDDPRPTGQSQLITFFDEEISFPPPRYDAYVLISVGPNAHTAGIPYYFGLPGIDASDYDAVYHYHVLAMMTYFMATRDSEQNGRGDGELDFDYRGRTTGGQSGNDRYLMPDGSARPGPLLFGGEA